MESVAHARFDRFDRGRLDVQVCGRLRGARGRDQGIQNEHRERLLLRLLAGAGAELPLAGPMMLLMTWSAAFCAAAAGKYTLMVTQPANNASMAATANRGLRIRNLQGAK